MCYVASVTTFQYNESHHKKKIWTTDRISLPVHMPSPLPRMCPAFLAFLLCEQTGQVLANAYDDYLAWTFAVL